MKTTWKGTIHGKTIALETAPGLPDGHKVSVTLEPVSPAASPTSAAALESLRRAAGAWAEDAEELDRYLEWNRRQRKGSRLGIAE